MTPQKQKTIQKDVALSGVGLHTGHQVTIRLKPAAENAGISFVRTDLPDKPALKVGLENISEQSDIPRCTSIGRGSVRIYTVEHFLSTLHGLGIDNLQVEIDNNELPGLDGSGLEFLRAIQRAGIVEQSAEKKYIDIKEPIGVSNNAASILIVPDPEFRVSYALDFNIPSLRAQFFSSTIDSQIFEKQIAPCRTFCLESETAELRTRGLGKGANYTNTLVLGEKGVIDNELRFPDECVRHKVLDFIGDLYLLGCAVRGHAFAIKSGHQLNIALLKKIVKQHQDSRRRAFVPEYKNIGEGKELDIQQVMKILPHRYPFLLVDKIIELEKGKKAVGIKNVTINENFFCGHFPARPVMPGVLMVEAMAQTGGVLVLTNEEHRGKLALFMAADNVKFRKIVEPGEQLFLEVEVVRDRPRTALLRGQVKVGGEVVTEADILLSFMDASFLN